MEIGAVKQAFNNEIILLKKNLNQAKIRIIHKLTRRSKQFAEKKGPEKLKEKFKKKAESAINEVLIIKKIKVKDLAKFAITHTGELKDFLNRPNIDHDKCCARLLLHKCLQEKYKTMRTKYSNIEIKDLFLSRIERRKQKKEERESRKKKKNNKVKSMDGNDDLSVEDVAAKDTDDVSDNICSDSEENVETGDEAFGDESTEDCFERGNSFEELKGEGGSESENEDIKTGSESESRLSNSGELKNSEKDLMEIETKSDSEPDKDSDNVHNQINFVESNKNDRKLKLKETIAEKKHKDNKNKNLKKKLTSRNFKKDKNEDIGETKMVADPFFITATGENYMSVVDKTETEELKQGNRRERRAAMFGLAPKIKSKSNNNTMEDKFNKQNVFRNSKSAKFQTKEDNLKQTFGKIEPEERSQEKLHPSWAAKKKQSGLLPFQGKKIVFDAS